MMLSEEWTQGYVVQLPDEHSVSELVEYIISQNRADLPHATKVSNVSQAFALSTGDTERAFERVAGGILFAAFGDADGHGPDSDSDPIAHESYQITVRRRQEVTIN